MHTPQKNLEVAQGLIATANATTGKEDTTLTNAVNSLVEGFGQGGSEEINYFEYITKPVYLFTKNKNLPKEMILDFPNFIGDNIEQIFAYASGVEYVKLSCEVRDVVTRTYAMFFDCRTVKVIDLTDFNRMLGLCLDTFNNAQALESIFGDLDFTYASQIGTMFNNCNNLKDVTLVKGSLYSSLKINSSSLLTDVSIQSLADGFADMTGQTAPTLQVHKTVKAKIEANQVWLATLTSKNVTLA